MRNIEIIAMMALVSHKNLFIVLTLLQRCTALCPIPTFTRLCNQPCITKDTNHCQSSQQEIYFWGRISGKSQVKRRKDVLWYKSFSNDKSNGAWLPLGIGVPYQVFVYGWLNGNRTSECLKMGIRLTYRDHHSKHRDSTDNTMDSQMNLCSTMQQA